MSWTDDFEMPDFTMHATIRHHLMKNLPTMWAVSLSWSMDQRTVPYNRKRPVIFCTPDRAIAKEAAQALQKRVTLARRLVGLRANKP